MLQLYYIGSCQTSEEAMSEYELMMQIKKLCQEKAELEKENDFLKKCSGILRKGNRLAAHRFIENNQELFGLRWLLRKFSICPNAYYNYLKDTKKDFRNNKTDIHNEIESIYHEIEGILGHRSMLIFLARKDIHISKTTVHKYMNKELRLFCTSRRRVHF